MAFSAAPLASWTAACGRGSGAHTHTHTCVGAKARQFLVAHHDHVSVQKLRRNKPLTAVDLTELDRVFVEGGIGSADDVQRARKENEGLGLFVRSLVGLDREAAKEALGEFTSGATHSGNQLEFVNDVVNYLTEHGTMPPERLYEPPYTDLHPKGVEGCSILAKWTS